MGKGNNSTVQVAVAPKPSPVGVSNKEDAGKKSTAPLSEAKSTARKAVDKTKKSKNANSATTKNTLATENDAPIKLPVTKKSTENPSDKPAKRKNASKQTEEEPSIEQPTADEHPAVEDQRPKKSKPKAKASNAGESDLVPPAKKSRKGQPKESPRSDATTEVTETHNTEIHTDFSSQSTTQNSQPDILSLKINLSDNRTCTVQDLLDPKHDIDSVGFVIYPKASTPGCTKQCIAFSEKKETFAQHGVAIVGVSTDSLQSQQSFVKNHDLNIALIAKGTNLLTALNSISPDGKTIRSVVAVDRHGNIFYEKHKVAAEKSADEFLAYLKERAEPPTEMVSEKEEVDLKKDELKKDELKPTGGNKEKMSSSKGGSKGKKSKVSSPSQIVKRGRKKAS